MPSMRTLFARSWRESQDKTDEPGGGRPTTTAVAGGKAPMAARLKRLLAEPSTWLGLAIWTLPLGSSRGPTPAQVTPSDVLIVIAAGIAGALVLRGRRPNPLLSMPLAGLAVAVTSTAVVALVADGYPGSLVGALRFTELFFLTPLAVLVGLRSRRDVMVVLGSLVGLAVVEGALGVLQTVTRTGASIGDASTRAVGTFGAYNILAMAQLTALALVVCLAWAVVRAGRERVTALLLAVFLALPLALSLSRGVWVAVAVASVAVVSRGRLWRMAGAIGSLGVFAAVAIPLLVRSDTGLGRRVSSLVSAASDPDQSFIDRQGLWSAAYQMAIDHPWTGVGPRAFAAHRDGYSGVAVKAGSDIAFGGDFQKVSLDSPHNFFLLVASEQGLVVAFVYTTILVVLLVRALVRSARLRSDVSTAVALVGAGALALQLTSMLTFDLGGPTSILIALSVGLAAWAAAGVDVASVIEQQPATAQPLGSVVPGSLDPA